LNTSVALRCLNCGQEFFAQKKNHYVRRFCSGHCRVIWQYKFSLTRKKKGKFKIDLQTLRELREERDLTYQAIARLYNVHPSTVLRRAKELNIVSGRMGFRSWRRISIPKNKVVFLISVDTMRGADLEIFLKDSLSGLPFKTNLIDTSTYKETTKEIRGRSPLILPLPRRSIVVNKDEV
jgi:transcriptional regulator with XRE-family HTH domain